MTPIEKGEGWAAGHLDDMGEGPGFRKVRHELGVEEMGVNAIVLPARLQTNFHYHDDQEELYYLVEGDMEIEFGDGGVVPLRPGSLVRVAAATARRLRNVGDTEATYLIVGAKGGYVGRDGRLPEGVDRGVTSIDQ